LSKLAFSGGGGKPARLRLGFLAGKPISSRRSFPP
jgi:hypothetical protein